MNAGGQGRPLHTPIKAEDYGLPCACPDPACGFRWLKLPGIKMLPGCPNCGKPLVSLRPRKRRR